LKTESPQGIFFPSIVSLAGDLLMEEPMGAFIVAASPEAVSVLRVA
jgi:hypothetical protein